MQDLTPFLLAIGNLSSSSSDSLGLVSMLPKSASFRTKFNSILAYEKREKGESLIIVIEKLWRIHIGLGYIYTC